MASRKRPSRRMRKIPYSKHDKGRRCASDRLASDDERSEFERDRSRIVHSAAFRRLQGKTQVFTPSEGDFFRTRLTHSLEVAQIGKGLALRLGADTDLVEAISLIHDLGHPPFGHAGESELKELMDPYGGFEANAQNIRILTKLESKSGDYDGLNLTRAVVDGQMKYKDSFPEENGKFVYADDTGLVDWASKEASVSVFGRYKRVMSFECGILDWADEVAYAVHDLEDSVHAGYIDAHHFSLNPSNDPRIRDIVEEVARKFKKSVACVTDSYNGLVKIMVEQNPDFRLIRPSHDHEQQKANRRRLTTFLIGRYIKCTSRMSRERADKGKRSVSSRYLYHITVPWQYRVEVALINRLVKVFVIQSPQISAMESKGRHIVKCLFGKLMHGDNAQLLLPIDWRERLPDEVEAGGKARVVSDYISGMTDGYAQKLYAKLFFPNYGSIYEVL